MRNSVIRKKDVIKVNILNPAGDQLETEIKDTKDGKYTVTYTPQCVGQHRVEIQVNGQPLTGSPWVVQVIPQQYQFLFQFGQGRLIDPWDIAVSDKSKILAVADYNNVRIQMFSFEGNLLREIAPKNNPLSLAFTESGDLLVRVYMDFLESKISLCTENGQFISYIGEKHVRNPRYVCVINNGGILTSDRAHNTIKVISPDGKNLLQSFKVPVCGEEAACVIYHHEKFFASFSRACRVMVFNNAGEYLHDIGSRGSGDGQIKNPIGLVVDKFSRLIVCDVGNRRLQLFTLDGKYISQISGSFFEESYLRYAVISNTGHLFVTDSRQKCVHVFH